MIQQDRFMRLLAAIEAYETRHDAYVKAFENAAALYGPGRNAVAAYGYLAGWFGQQSRHALDYDTLCMVADERAHFKVNAKRNAKQRAYMQRKRALEDHNEYKARVRQPAPWAGAIKPPVQPIVAKPLSHEEMTRLNEAARQMPQYDQEPDHIREVREKMLEAMKRLPEGKSLQIPDEEILGDVDEDFNPFA